VARSADTTLLESTVAVTGFTVPSKTKFAGEAAQVTVGVNGSIVKGQSINMASSYPPSAPPAVKSAGDAGSTALR